MSNNFTLLSTKLRGALAQLAYLPRALTLVWAAARVWTLAWVVLLLVQGLLPVATVYLFSHHHILHGRRRGTPSSDDPTLRHHRDGRTWNAGVPGLQRHSGQRAQAGRATRNDVRLQFRLWNHRRRGFHKYAEHSRANPRRDDTAQQSLCIADDKHRWILSLHISVHR